MVQLDAPMAKRYLYVNDDQFVLDKAATLGDWDHVPVMLQFHLMSAHSLGERHEPYAKYKPYANYALRSPGQADSLEPARNYYDNGVLQADGFIHELLEILARKGYLQNTLVVVTADHGEALGEHGFFAHAHGVTEEELRIPFLTFTYGYEPKSRFAASGPVSQVDIAPTLLAEFAMPLPATWAGVPLQERDRQQSSFFQQWHAIGLIDRRDPKNIWKYWVNRRSGEEQVFNLTRDPVARNDVADTIGAAERQEWRRHYLEVLGATEGIEKTRDLIYSIRTGDAFGQGGSLERPRD